VIRVLRGSLLSFAIMLSGCAGFSNGAPQLIVPQDLAGMGIRRSIASAITADCLDISAQLPTAEERQARRNRLVSAYMFAVDVGYNEYERNLLDSVRENDLGAATASLALSSIGSVIGIEELARALDTTNAIVTGTHTAIGRDYLLNQTLTTLQTHMRASRSQQRAVLLHNRSLTIDEWDSCQALSDVLLYEQAGTLNAAIAAMAASAADSERAGTVAVQQAIERVAFTTNALTDALNAYFAPDNDALMNARLGRAAAYLAAAGLTVPANMGPGERLTRILDGANAVEVRALALGVLRTEQDQAAKAPIVSALTSGNGG
jgi:hypothetical protein